MAGGEVAGPWGALCGAITFGLYDSFKDAIVTANNNDDGKIHGVTVNALSSNIYDYLGEIHNQGIVDGYLLAPQLLNTNGTVNDTLVANYVAGFIKSRDEFKTNYDSAAYCKLLLSTPTMETPFDSYLDSLHSHSVISDNVYNILSLYYTTSIGLDKSDGIAAYNDEVLAAIIEGTDLKDNDKLLVQTVITIGRSSALLSFRNYNF